ncbi:MAG: protein kinase [Chloracidobacterium sp.]|nr:protein kinase [Chloracidobacterium sp.]MDW8218470.1 serine/threonine-protein kinase [Acidobacteriota bacterium]
MKECPKCKFCFEDEVSVCPHDGATLAQSLRGSVLIDNKYRLEKCLGRGGMGAVYRAKHIHLGRTVAVKTLLHEYATSDATAVSRFQREARAASAIEHPNVVRALDFGITSDGTRYIVMEYVEGRPLNEIIFREAPMAPTRVLKIFKQALAGIAAAHDLKLVHRDLKPANIMVSERSAGANLEDLGLILTDDIANPTDEPEMTVKVLDFGLAKILNDEILGDDNTDLKTGIMGTPFYMSPEQCSAKPVDARSDIYSLGVILYQMLTKDVPFRGDSFAAIVSGHLTQPPPSIRARNPDVSPELEAVVMRALAKNPAHRQSSVRELLAELEAAILKKPSGDAAALLQTTPTLFITSTPGNCNVEVDGEFRGKTNAQGKLELRLPPGEYRLRFTAPGWNDQARTVVMGQEDQSLDVRLTHKTAVPVAAGVSTPLRPATGSFSPATTALPATGGLRPATGRFPTPPPAPPPEVGPRVAANTGFNITLDILLTTVGVLAGVAALTLLPAAPLAPKQDQALWTIAASLLFDSPWWFVATGILSTLVLPTCLLLADYVYPYRPVPVLVTIFNITRIGFLVVMVGGTVVAALGALLNHWEWPSTGWLSLRFVSIFALGALYSRIAARRRAVVV